MTTRSSTRKDGTCILCHHPNIVQMEVDFNAGFTDPEIAAKYGVADRTWRSHRAHSPTLKAASPAEIKKTAKIPDLDETVLSSKEVKLILQLEMRRSCTRLADLAVQTQSVKAELALQSGLMNLDKLLNGVEFER